MSINWKINVREKNDFYENSDDSVSSDKDSSLFDKFDIITELLKQKDLSYISKKWKLVFW